MINLLGLRCCLSIKFYMQWNNDTCGYKNGHKVENNFKDFIFLEEMPETSFCVKIFFLFLFVGTNLFGG